MTTDSIEASLELGQTDEKEFVLLLAGGKEVVRVQVPRKVVERTYYVRPAWNKRPTKAIKKLEWEHPHYVIWRGRLFHYQQYPEPHYSEDRVFEANGDLQPERNTSNTLYDLRDK